MLGIACLVTALMFTFLATGLIRRDSGPEVFGEQIWWKDWRWVHAVTYFLAGALLTGSTVMRQQAWVVLFVDVVLGAIAYTVFSLQ